MSKTNESGHWYIPSDNGTGTAAHHLGLAGAREVKAFPSATTVLKERSNEALIYYVKKQVFLATREHKKKKGETEDAYMKRIFEAANEHSNKAKELGTLLHHALENYPAMPTDPKLKPYIEHFDDWYKENIVETIATEVCVVDNDIGIGGTIDLVANTKRWGIAIVDYKTSEFKYGKARFWPSYRAQLSFYAVAWQKRLGLPTTPAIVNVGINSTEPMPCQHVAYTLEDQQQAYREFLATAYLWFAKSNYWPVGQSSWGVHMKVGNRIISA